MNQTSTRTVKTTIVAAQNCYQLSQISRRRLLRFGSSSNILCQVKLKVQPVMYAFFLPKFHCELNWIERFWGASKDYARAYCLYTLPGLRETVPLSLTQDIAQVPAHLNSNEMLPVATLLKQRRWARVSRRYMAEYRKGKDACAAVKAVQLMSSKRHRDTSDRRSRRTEALLAATLWEA